MANLQTVQYKYTSTKEYIDAFPCAYRQWRADSHCNLNHGYSFSMKFYFGTNDLDVRNWAADYGGLKDLKNTLEDQFDHCLLVSADDPELETYKLLQEKKMAKLTGWTVRFSGNGIRRLTLMAGNHIRATSLLVIVE